MQNAPVGTSWIYQDIRGGAEKKVIEAIEDVTTPAGTFTQCVRTCGYDANDLTIEYECEWVKPGFGIVRTVDHYPSNAPIVTELTNYGKGPIPITIPPQ